MKNMRETEQDTSGFPTGVANTGGGGSSKFDGGRGGLKSKHGGEHGGA